MKMHVYQDIRENIQTGDIILYSGGEVRSMAVRVATRSIWGHVAIALKSEEDGRVLCWEATDRKHDLNDVEVGKPIRGVQLTYLSERVAHHKGKLAIRHLQKVTIDTPMKKNLMKLKAQLTGRAYEKNRVELLKSWIDVGEFSRNKEDLSSVFCSELVAEAYQALGLLQEPPLGLPSNEYLPKDFASEKELSLLQGHLSKEFYIDLT